MGMDGNGWEWMGMAPNVRIVFPLVLTTFFFLGDNNIMII
jgi:hypothetical protein